MRLNRLDLTRYGRFSDAQIVLPAPVGDTADVTLIYGANEAGKSTAFTAYLELLFGMKPRNHPYDFRFKRSDLMIGAELTLPQKGTMTLQRNSKAAQSLLDDQGRPVDEAILTGALHGLGRDDYVERFSLDDEGLRQGGARIAGAQGDLGQLLHAGVSGLTSMANTLDAMTKRADEFHKKAGRNTALKLGKDRLTQIAQELRAARLTPEREQTLAAANHKAKAEYEMAAAALRTAGMRTAAAQAAQVWYDLSQEMTKSDADLAAFPAGPNLPKDAAAQIARLVTTISEKTARIAEAEDKIADLLEVIATNPIDPLAATIADELAQLDQIMIDGASLMARATTATSDLGKRTHDRDGLHDQIGQILNGLSLGDVAPASLCLAARDLEDLGQAAQAVLSAQTAMYEAEKSVTSAKAQHGDAPAAPQDLTQLQAAFDAWQSVSDISVAQNTLTTETARLATATAGLPATWATLVAAGLPARETLLELARNLVASAADLAAANTALATAEATCVMAKALCDAAEAEPAAIDAATTGQTRRARDASWVAHRADMSPQTADRFEALMQGHDDAHASFADGAEARQQLATARRDAAAAKAARDIAQARVAEKSDQHDALMAGAAQSAIALGLAPDTHATAFAERFAALMHAAEIAAQLENAKAVFAAQSDRLKTATQHLGDAATAVGITCAPRDVPNHARAALTLQDSVRQTWNKWNDGTVHIAVLSENVAGATASHAAARQHLGTLTAALPLPDRTANAIIAALPHLRNLHLLERERIKLDERIGALERAVAELDASAARITAIMGGEGDADATSLSVIASARSRAATGERAVSVYQDAKRQHDKEDAVRKAAVVAVAEAKAMIAVIFDGQGAQDMPALARCAQLCARDDLRAARMTHDTARQNARAGVDADLFDAELAMLPDVTHIAEVLRDMDDAGHARDDARAVVIEAQRLYDAAYGATDLSDLATEQATIREELRAGARQAAVARLGVLAAKGALRRLASERRTTMLRDVEEAFVAITAPAYQSVEVWDQFEGEKLAGVQPDGNRVPVEMMSTGTMGQLYFALRVAGYRSFARDLGPLPMVLDDIMETFDDTRAKAALHLCADIGRSGQAIIFTHHAHLVDLARDTIDGVSIVAMPS